MLIKKEFLTKKINIMDTIYIRTLKRAEHTVFCVQDGQKTYFDPQFKRSIPYSSGQQVKRSILDGLNKTLETVGSPTTFLWDVTTKKELKEGEVYGTCDPSYPDQLFGGWMKASKAVKGEQNRTIKRRSPLSISAMRALHPLLAGVKSENISFDRSDRSNNEIVVRNANGEVISDDEVLTLLEGKDRSLRRKWIPDNKRATGLFVQDIAIDLRRLYSVTLNPFEPEITEATETKLRGEGWEEGVNVFGPCLTAPENLRKEWAKALSTALIEWQITSNQARTFSLMETLAVAISDKPINVAAAIRAKLTEDEDAKPVIEEKLSDTDIFVTLPASGFVLTSTESHDALEKAKQKLLDLINPSIA